MKVYVKAAKGNTMESLLEKFRVEANNTELGVLMNHLYYYVVRSGYDGDLKGFLHYYRQRTYDNPRSGSYRRQVILKDIDIIMPLIVQFRDFSQFKKFTSAMFRVWDKNRDAFGLLDHDYYE